MTKNESLKLNTILDELKMLKKIILGNGEAGHGERIRNLEKTRKHFFRLPTSFLIFLQIVTSILVIVFLFKK